MNFDNVKQTVRDATDFADVVSQYTTLKPAGKRMKGLSPFTNEKTPSFFVDPEAGIYYCFSTNKGGDMFTFVQEMEGVSFREALKILADRAGITIDTHGASSPKHDYTNLYHILESTSRVFEKNINTNVKKYLSDRGITEEMIKRWGIGYAPDAWNTLCTPQTPNLDEYVQAGICIKKESNVYDRFRGRVIFPFYDTRNRIIGFSGREYPGKTGAKYINSPESPLFNKSNFLYGLHLAKQYIRKYDFSILTEGPVDAIMAHKAGYYVAVATSGTAVTIEHIQQLQRLSNRLLIAFDGDIAGTRAALRVITMALSEGMDVKIVPIPDGTDPADMILEDAEQFRTEVKRARPVIPFMQEYIKKTYGETSEDILRGVKEEMLPIIARIQDSLMREHAINETAAFCSLSKEVIKENVDQVHSTITDSGYRRKTGAVNDSAYQDSAYQQQGFAYQQIESVGRRNPDEIVKRKNTDQLVSEFLDDVAHARNFLLSHNVSFTDEMSHRVEEIQKYEHIPEIDENIVNMRYEESVPDEAARNDFVIKEFMDMSSRLLSQLKKQEEIKKVRKNMKKEAAS